MGFSSSNRQTATRIRLCRAVAAAGAAGAILSFSPAPAVAQDDVSAEVDRRMQAAGEAAEFVAQGDAAAAEGDHATAVLRYREALAKLPAGAAGLRPQRDAVVDRFAAASVDRARELAETGEFDQARALLNAVLAPDVARDHKAAATLLKNLDDPDRFNPAMSPEHGENVRKVTRLLQLAQGLVDRGSFEEARGAYNQVLAIDPTNTAARRGMEDASRHISDYLRAARDQTRSRMLNEVDRLWESPVRVAPDTEDAGGGGAFAGSQSPGFRGKLRVIEIPELSLTGANVVDVLSELARLSIEFDTTEPDPSRRGVNIVFDPSGKDPASFPPVTLTLRNATLEQLLDSVCQVSGTVYRYDGHTVLVKPLGSADARLSTRRFRVPSGFLSTAGTGAGVDAGSLFTTDGGEGESSSSGLLIRRMDAKEFFERAGILFPEGAGASYNAATGTLIVRNTEENLNLIEEFIVGIAETGEREVLVEVRLLKTDERTLNELGFDSNLGQFNLGSSGIFAGGGTWGNVTAPDVALANPGSFINPATGQPMGQFPVTAGLRGAFDLTGQPGIDSLLASAAGVGAVAGPSPGFAAIGGAFTDPQFQTVLRGVNQKKNIEVGAKQSIVLKSGQRGTAASLRTIMIPTEFDPPQIPQTLTGSQTITFDPGGGITVANDPQQPGFPVTPTTPQNFEPRDTGSALEVEATVSPDGHSVDLTMSVSFKEFEGFVNYGTPITDPATGVVLTENRIIQPVISDTAETVNVTLYDGAHMAIGGLLNGKWETIEDQVPILGSLPIIGRLFKSDVRQVSRRAIVYLVSVRVIDPSGIARQDGSDDRATAALPPP